MSKWTQGMFANSMAWSCYGTSEKVALLIPGGPGNPAPNTGWQGKFGIKALLPLLEQGFRLVAVARPRNMPKGHSVADMAGEYARMIEAEFGGQVDLVIGLSYGGMIGQYLAADYPGCFKHIVIVVAACEVHDPDGIDQQFAKARQSLRVACSRAVPSCPRPCFQMRSFRFSPD